MVPILFIGTVSGVQYKIKTTPQDFDEEEAPELELSLEGRFAESNLEAKVEEAYYGLDASKALLAINVGITAPLIIKGLAAAVPAAPVSRDLESKRSVVDILAGR